MLMEDSPEPAASCPEIKVLKRLAQARSEVYLVQDTQGELYAMKMFMPEPSGAISRFYINEINLNHNDNAYVTKNAGYMHEMEIFKDGKMVKVSCLFMEYAPNGDMFDLLVSTPIFMDEIITRTYFHQLICGLEYLHSNNIAHLDLKLENLLLGRRCELKITDFDLSSTLTEPEVKGNGTFGFRAPEILSGKCEDLIAADIYSAGIILFVLKTGGRLPHSEGKKVNNIDLTQLMFEDEEAFWEEHGKIHPDVSFDEDFKTLFIKMTKKDPRSRFTIEEIKNSSWFCGSTYNPKELVIALKECMSMKHN